MPDFLPVVSASQWQILFFEDEILANKRKEKERKKRKKKKKRKRKGKQTKTHCFFNLHPSAAPPLAAAAPSCG